MVYRIGIFKLMSRGRPPDNQHFACEYISKGRALDNIWVPWMIVTLNAIIWTTCAELLLDEYHDDDQIDNWNFVIGIVLNTSLAFLLVFRLNRAAERYWLGRETWGFLVADERFLVNGIMIHGQHEPIHRDAAVAWAATFAVATMQHIRDAPNLSLDMLAGVLEPEEIERMTQSQHWPLYASDQLRAALKEIFRVTCDTSPGLAHAWSEQLSGLEQTLNHMVGMMGSMERIKTSPLPLVYVTHLRTFLLFFLLALPYAWQPAWGWPTIPVVIVTAFALLGLEGAAEEVEAPFRQDRPNHLNMDSFCLLIMTNIQQLLRNSADREIQEKEREARSGNANEKEAQREYCS